MLYSVLVAYKRKVFSDDYKKKLPFEINIIEDYVQILLPLYAFSQDMQSNKAHIGLVVPGLLALVYETLDRMVLKDEN